MVRHIALKSAARASLMRHFRVAGAASGLSGRMTRCPPVGMLVACAGPVQRLATADPRTLARAVDVAVIASRANAHLHPTTLTVVESISRQHLLRGRVFADPPSRV